MTGMTDMWELNYCELVDLVLTLIALSILLRKQEEFATIKVSESKLHCASEVSNKFLTGFR